MPDVGPLDTIVSAADPAAGLAERIDWLIALFRWIRQRVTRRQKGGSRSEHLRLRRLFALLDQQPEWKHKVARTLRSIVHDTCALDLFCETGLPREHGFFSEAIERVSHRMLPQPPYDGDLGNLFGVLLPRPSDAEWLRTMDVELCGRIRDLFFFEVDADEAGWNTLPADMEDAVIHLSGQVASVGGSTPVRSRLNRRNFRETPFARLLPAVNTVLETTHQADQGRLATDMLNFHAQLDACHQAIDQTAQHLEEFGVSPGLVYRLERMRAQLGRVGTLMELLVQREPTPQRHAEFTSELARENQDRLGLRSLWRDTLSIFGRRLVDRSAEAGEHYITRTKGEYLSMLARAAGGGAVMAQTMVVKVILLSMHLSLFLTGFFAGLNYAASFVLVQLCGFTVATKQPANTAPALARQMHELRDARHLDALVDEIVFLIRSQAAAIMGNVLMTVPCAILTTLAFPWILGRPLMSPEKCLATVQSLSVLGPSLLFAALTGVLLWMSGLLAGMADNWFACRRVGQALEHNPGLQRWVGMRRIGRWVALLRRNVAGLAGNISLGFMLGMFPEICHFIGLPLDVRHVTLSAAGLAASMTGAPPGLVSSQLFWSAAVGVLAIGFLNVVVSFALALFLAIRARQVRSPERGLVYRALLQRVIRRPLSFLVPTETR